MNKMKFLILSLAITAAPLMSCKEIDYYKNDVKGKDVQNVELDVSYLKLEIGESYQLTPTITYYNDKEVKVYTEWRSSNSSVADVDKNGFVSALSGGTATITFLAGISGSASCTIDVPKPDDDDPIPQPGEFTIRLNSSSETLALAGTFQLVATTSEEASVTWAVTEGEGVVTVDNNGLVTAGNVSGTATVTANANGKSASCYFNVTEEAIPEDPADPVDPGDDEDYKTVQYFFFLDYNNVDEADTTGKRLLARFMWYPNRPVGESGLVPANPTVAPTSDFPYFIGWSTQPIIDDKEKLIDVNTYKSGDSVFYKFIFGIWSDVPGGQF